MENLTVLGGKPLRGSYKIKGAKNSALPIMAASLCAKGSHHIANCPKIKDVFVMEEILNQLGAKTLWEDGGLTIDSTNVTESVVSPSLMGRLRSSVFLLGSLLCRLGEASITKPGGCKIGKRPIDLHIKGLMDMGYSFKEEENVISFKGRAKGGIIRLAYPSVGATENIIMAALNSNNCTLIENCAMEPEIADLQGFLRNLGYEVYGAGTPYIMVRGREKKAKIDSMYFLLEDRIEAATYMMAVAGTRGRALLRGIRPEILLSVIETLKSMGVKIKSYDNDIEVEGGEKLVSPGIIVTKPYPAFPTDCQPQLMSLLAISKGITTIREEIFESRFTHKKELVKMGADIETCGKNAIIKGVEFLQGKRVLAYDLRGGAALVLAGLFAEGKTIIDNVEHIDRGYESIEKGLCQLGGLIERNKS